MPRNNITHLIANLTEDEKSALIQIYGPTDSTGAAFVATDVSESLFKKGLLRNLPNENFAFTSLGETVYDHLRSLSDAHN